MRPIPFYIGVCSGLFQALNYYEAAIKKGNRSVRQDYIGLLVKLKRLERAESLLIDFTTEVVTGEVSSESELQIHMNNGKGFFSGFVFNCLLIGCGSVGLNDQIQSARFLKSLADLQALLGATDKRLTTLRDAKDNLEK